MGMKPTKTLTPAIVCFSHPLTWGAIILLLLNDQVWKYIYPSWWTGKLSDFAGLFFLPFIVATLLGLVLLPVPISNKKVGQIAFGLVAIWFTLMKTTPVFNQATEVVWSWLVGYSVRIVQDPTDLLALMALFPAWRLWQNALAQPETRHKTPALNWLGLIVLGFSALVGLASSCAEDPRIDKVVFGDGAFYVWDGYSDGYNIRLLPGVNVWEDFPPSVPEAIEEQFAAPRTLPIVTCLTQQENVCYRVDGTEQVLASEDGGVTWRVDWEIPAGRRQFMARFPQGCGGYLDMGPYDLAIAETDEGHYVVVAMGTEGVLVRQADGSWVQQAVFEAIPTPLFATSFAEIYQVLPSEFTYLILFASVISLVIFLTIWKRPRLLVKPFLVALGVQVVYLFWVTTSVWDIEDLALGLVATAGPYFPVMMVGGYIVWLRESNLIPQIQTLKMAGHLWFFMGLGMFFGGMMPFVLWATGVIAYYETAWRISMLLTLLIVVGGIWRLRQLKIGSAP